MSLDVRFVSQVKVVETFEGPFVSPADGTATFDQLTESEQYTGATSVPATKHAEYELALAAGAGTINLAALPGKTGEETVNGTGLKVQLLKLRNKDTNANDITVAVGASNGHTLLGAAWTFTLKPGQSITFKGDDAGPDIASGNRVIDVTGTGSQVLEVQAVMG